MKSKFKKSLGDTSDPTDHREIQNTAVRDKLRKQFPEANIQKQVMHKQTRMEIVLGVSRVAVKPRHRIRKECGFRSRTLQRGDLWTKCTGGIRTS